MTPAIVPRGCRLRTNYQERIGRARVRFVDCRIIGYGLIFIGIGKLAKLIRWGSDSFHRMIQQARTSSSDRSFESYYVAAPLAHLILSWNELNNASGSVRLVSGRNMRSERDGVIAFYASEPPQSGGRCPLGH